MACGISLSNAAHASQSPQSNTPWAVADRDVSVSPLSLRMPSSCSAIYIVGRLLNGLTANDRSHQIYPSQQRSLGKGLMLTKTVAQRDRQTLPIFIHRYTLKDTGPTAKQQLPAILLNHNLLLLCNTPITSLIPILSHSLT